MEVPTSRESRRVILRDFDMATTAEFRHSLVGWIVEHREELEPPYRDHGSTEELLAHQRRLQRLLFDEGWMRWGWPTAVGGLGGTPLFRAVLGEELTGRGLVHSAAYSMTEVLAPAVIEYASPSLSAEVVPPMLRGDESWCQGFSEPEAGSDLGSLRTTAERDGEVWVLRGQKLWTSWAHHAARCIVLARTEGPDTGSRGISAFFVDMDAPGVSVRPLHTMAGVDEFCETFFDEVRVPVDRLLGTQGHGWQVAQHILACERGPIFWQRASWLLHHLGEIAGLADASDVAAQRLLGLAFARSIRAAGALTLHPIPGRRGRPASGRVLHRQDADRIGRPGRLRRRPSRTPWRSRARRLAFGRSIPKGMGVLACGDDLRRDRGDPTRHRGVPTVELAQGLLMDADEIELLTATMLGVVDTAPVGQLTDSLDEFGWRDVLAAHPKEAIASLFSAQGRTGRWSSALQDVLASDVARLGIDGDANVVLPRPNTSTPGMWRNGEATVHGVLLEPRDDRGTLVIAGRSDDGEYVVIAVEPEDLRIERRDGLDPALGVRNVSGTTRRVTVLHQAGEAGEWWEAAQARGRLALCHQMVAALFVMVEQARAHVSERAQFGRLVGTFQAVRHKLVDAHVASTAADCCTSTAWETEDLSLAAATAKVVTGQAVSVTAANVQQLLAGIGFTAEHPFHHFMKRALVLERMLGSAAELAPQVGRQLVERGKAPRLVQL